MTRKKIYIVVEIGEAALKMVVFDAALDRLIYSSVKDLSSCGTPEERDAVVTGTVKEALEKETASLGRVKEETAPLPPLDRLRTSPAAFFKELREWAACAVRRLADAYYSTEIVGILSLEDGSVHVRRIDLPHMPVNEIRDALRWRMKGLIPIDIEKAVMDFDVIGETTEEDGARKMDIIVAAALNDAIEGKLALLKNAGFNSIGGVNIDLFGFANIVADKPEARQGRAVAVLKIGRKASTVAVYREGKLVFIRNIPQGVDNIKASIRDSIPTESGRVELSEEELESLRSVGIPGNNDVLLGGKLEGKHLLVYMRPVIGSLSSEIARSIEYYKSHIESREISKLYITGDGSEYRHLDSSIKEALRIDTECLSLGAEAQCDTSRMVSLIGVARAGSGAKADLLPVGFKLEKVQEVQRVLIHMTGIAVFSVILVSFIMMSVRLGDYRKRLVTAQTRAKTLSELRELHSEILERERLVGLARADEPAAVSIMKELSILIPNSIILTHFSLDQNKVMTVKGSVHMGAEVGEVILSDFMKVMEASGYFRDVNLVSSEKGEAEGKTVVLFVVSCLAE